MAGSKIPDEKNLMKMGISKSKEKKKAFLYIQPPRTHQKTESLTRDSKKFNAGM
jgi:hypothetical protein